MRGEKLEYTQNRELSWLRFNQRVLEEAQDESVPLLERMKFVAIFTSNLDEFFMIRVAGLRHQAMNGIVKHDAAHMDAKAQLKAIDESVQRLVSLQYTYLHRVLADLKEKGFSFFHDCSPVSLTGTTGRYSHFSDSSGSCRSSPFDSGRRRGRRRTARLLSLRE